MCGNIMVNIKLFNINGNELKINNLSDYILAHFHKISSKSWVSVFNTLLFILHLAVRMPFLYGLHRINRNGQP